MRWIFSTVTASIFALAASSPALGKTQTYKFDKEHTYVEWHINHFGFSSQTGKWYTDGTLALDEANPQKSKVNVTIQVANLTTGNPELDSSLKGGLFFDVAKFPTATFVSNKVNVTGKDSAKVTGILTVHGVTKTVVLDVKFNKKGVNPITNKMTVGFSATTEVKRSDFDITTLLPMVGNDVKLSIEVEASKVAS